MNLAFPAGEHAPVKMTREAALESLDEWELRLARAIGRLHVGTGDTSAFREIRGSTERIAAIAKELEGG